MVDERETDPRTRRTRARLSESLTELLRNSPLRDVSVAGLCRAAGIHRTTFYKHYPSVAACAADVFDDLLIGLTRVASGQPQASSEPPGRVGTSSADELRRRFRKELEAMLCHVVQHRALYRRLTAAEGDMTFFRLVVALLAARAGELHEQLAEEGVHISAERATADQMVGAALAAALGVWAVGASEDAAQRASELFDSLPPWWQPTSAA